MSLLASYLLAAAGSQVGGWDLSNASYNGTPLNWFYVGGQEYGPQGVSFKSDGTKMYVIGYGADSVFEYNLSTAWDVSTASYLQNFSVSTQEGSAAGLFFKSDGTKMYVIGYGSDKVNEYNLSTAWDVSTASYSQNFSVATEDTLPTGLYFKPDGTRMYIIGFSADKVVQYNLSTAWDISTASYNQNFSVSAQDGLPMDLFFKSDGTKMYVVGGSGDDINEYSLSTAWDISTASYVRNFSVSAQEGSPAGLFFKPDGTKMYVVGALEDTVFAYDLSTAWNLSTASFTYPTSDYYKPTQEDQLSDVFLKPDGTKMYTINYVDDNVYEYNLSTAWNQATASYVQNFNLGSGHTYNETYPKGLVFKPDGTRMYVVGNGQRAILQYNLSTAWDISTASYNQNRYIGGTESAPNGLFWKPDGTKVYVVGSSGDAVYEYNASLAWFAQYTSYVQSFSVSAQETDPQDLFFKDDGTKMYIIGTVGDAVYEYDLSTAWDISTASYSQNFSVSAKASYPEGLFFKDDGTKMYITDYNEGVIWSYDL
jgi:DNA-binding beta-propeller fold protein YncE